MPARTCPLIARIPRMTTRDNALADRPTAQLHAAHSSFRRRVANRSPRAADRPEVAPGRSALRGFLPAAFFASGAAGLIAEIVWTRMLSRILGATVDASSAVLCAFMAGIAGGAYLIGRHSDRLTRPLLTYARLELGIAAASVVVAAILTPEALAPVFRAIADTLGGGGSLAPARALVALVALLPPTLLMGATLPVVTSACDRAGGRSSVAALYAINTVGAVLGTFLGGFVLIAWVGERGSLAVAILLNLAAALGAWLDHRRRPLAQAPERSRSLADDPAAPVLDPQGRAVLAAIAASGFVAMGTEIAWSRLLLVYQGTSIYAFSSMLLVMLTCMAIGSWAAGLRPARGACPLRSLARAIFAAGASLCLGLWLYDKLAIREFSFLSTKRILANWAYAPFLLLGPSAFFSGAAFPYAARALTNRTGAGQGVSRALYANTLGAILGAWCSGFLLIPSLGSARTAACLAASSVLVGAGLSVRVAAKFKRSRHALAIVASAVACLVVLAFLGDPYGRLMLARAQAETKRSGFRLYHHGEDRAGAVTAFGDRKGERLRQSLWVNGVGMTQLVSVTKLMAHLPIWLADDPKTAEVICLGMGTCVKSTLTHQNMHARVVELMPQVIDCVRYFQGCDVRELAPGRIEVIADDGRNDLLRARQTFDVITLDPAPPLHSAGTVNLYSSDFMALCRERLSPGGVVCVWLPPERLDDSLSVLRGFAQEFPHVRVFSGSRRDNGFLLLGRKTPFGDVAAKIKDGFRDPATVRDLAEWDDEFASAERVLSHEVGDRDLLIEFAGAGPVNSDDHPFTEFPLWRAVTQRSAYARDLHARDLETFRDRVRSTRALAARPH